MRRVRPGARLHLPGLIPDRRRRPRSGGGVDAVQPRICDASDTASGWRVAAASSRVGGLLLGRKHVADADDETFDPDTASDEDLDMLLAENPDLVTPTGIDVDAKACGRAFDGACESQPLGHETGCLPWRIAEHQEVHLRANTAVLGALAE